MLQLKSTTGGNDVNVAPRKMIALASPRLAECPRISHALFHMRQSSSAPASFLLFFGEGDITWGKCKFSDAEARC